MADSFKFFSSFKPSATISHLETKQMVLAQQFFAIQKDSLAENKANNPANKAEKTVIENMMRICM